MKHKHRIVPGHRGGEYVEGNVIEVPPTSCDRNIASHCMWHWAEYFLWGNPYDKIAAMGLAGYLGEEEIIKAKCSESGKRNASRLDEWRVENALENQKVMNVHPNTVAARKRGAAAVENVKSMNVHPNTVAARRKQQEKLSIGIRVTNVLTKEFWDFKSLREGERELKVPRHKLKKLSDGTLEEYMDYKVDLLRSS